MPHEIKLFQVARMADQLNALLLAMKFAADNLDTTDMNTLFTLALDLAGEPAVWLLEEESQRSAAEVRL